MTGNKVGKIDGSVGIRDAGERVLIKMELV